MQDVGYVGGEGDWDRVLVRVYGVYGVCSEESVRLTTGAGEQLALDDIHGVEPPQRRRLGAELEAFSDVACAVVP